jgi:hypothetical protein
MPPLSSLTKWCSGCEADLPVSEFCINRSRSDGLSGLCNVHQKAADRKAHNARRLKVLQAMGGKCVHCGFSDWRALQIDHVNGGGRAEKLKIGSTRYYKHVLAHPDDYQLLCANCNWIKKHENDENKVNFVVRRVIPIERRGPVRAPGPPRPGNPQWIKAS